MKRVAVVFGLGLLIEGLVKQFRPKQWISWLVNGPIAYLPEPLLMVGREYQSLSPSALRLLGLVELAAGATILGLACPCRARPCRSRP